MKQAATIDKCHFVYSWQFCLSEYATERQSAGRMMRKDFATRSIASVCFQGFFPSPAIRATLQSSHAFYHEDSVLKKKGGKRITSKCITMLHVALFSILGQS